MDRAEMTVEAGAAGRAGFIPISPALQRPALFARRK
jgi:hypothetical protein